jgi:hypothetical protein
MYVRAVATCRAMYSTPPRVGTLQVDYCFNEELTCFLRLINYPLAPGTEIIPLRIGEKIFLSPKSDFSSF